MSGIFIFLRELKVMYLNWLKWVLQNLNAIITVLLCHFSFNNGSLSDSDRLTWIICVFFFMIDIAHDTKYAWAEIESPIWRLSVPPIFLIKLSIYPVKKSTWRDYISWKIVSCEKSEKVSPGVQRISFTNKSIVFLCYQTWKKTIFRIYFISWCIRTKRFRWKFLTSMCRVARYWTTE